MNNMYIFSKESIHIAIAIHISELHIFISYIYIYIYISIKTVYLDLKNMHVYNFLCP